MKRRNVQLGEVCDFIRGVTFDKADATVRPQIGKTPILRAGNIGDELDTQNDLLWVPDAQVSDTQRFRQNDIVICMSSGSPEVVGKTARVAVSQNASVGSFCGIIRPKNAVEASYLSFFFKSPLFFKHRNAIARGANIQNLRFSQFEEIEIEIPDEQQRIAGELERVDGLRRTRRYALELAGTFLPAAFLQLFGDPGTNPKQFPFEQVETLFSETCDGVKCGPFGSALKKHEYVSDGIPVWTVDCIGNNEFYEANSLYITPEKFEELGAYSAENNDILVSRAGTVGRMAIVQTKHARSIIHSNVIRLSLNPAKCQPVFFVALMTHFASRVGRLKRGQEDAYSFMNTSTLGELQIPLPPPELQTRFAELVERHQRLRTVQRQSLRQAEHLFQALLHQAFKTDN